jgi:50S ribosomal subunit-associated GTPase HflX
VLIHSFISLKLTRYISSVLFLSHFLQSVNKMRDRNATNSFHDAIVFARKASKKYGLNSTQSVLAWNQFDKIASDRNLESMPMSDIECLLESAEKCIALEGLQQALKSKVKDVSSEPIVNSTSRAWQ